MRDINIFVIIFIIYMYAIDGTKREKGDVNCVESERKILIIIAFSFICYKRWE